MEESVNDVELTILMPCLNEAETIGVCMEHARKLLLEYDICGEILVSDNGSTDGSQQLVKAFGARVVSCSERGYGAALLKGIKEAKGNVILMGDSDDSYHFDEAFPMIRKIREGYDVCMGTRLKGEIKPGAMPKLNRLLGNPVLTWIGQTLFKIPTTDFHCGMRAFRRDRIMALGLVTTGMEWASDMIIKSALNGLSLTEVPVTLHKDGRNRPPHLRPWRDGWRHLRLMLLHAPHWLFSLPGNLLMAFGTLGQILLISGMVQVGQVSLGIHTMLACAFAMVTGVQVIFTGMMAKLYCFRSGILPPSLTYTKILKDFNLEKLLVISLVCAGIGTAGIMSIVYSWWEADFGPLDYSVSMRQLIPSLSLLTIALLSMFNGFMMSILFLNTKKTVGIVTAEAPKTFSKELTQADTPL